MKIASALFDPDKSILFSRPPSDEDLYFYVCLIRQLMLSNPLFFELEAFATTCLSHTSTCYCHVLCRIFKYYEQQERRLVVSESTIRTFLSTHGLCCRERRYFYKLLPYLARTTSVLAACDFVPSDPCHLVSLFRCALEGEDLRYVRTVMGPDASLSPSEVLDLVDENDKHVLSVLDCVSSLVLRYSELPPQICYEFVADFIRRMEGDVSITDEKNTDDLKQELMAEPDIDAYIKENEAFFASRSITELLAELYENQKISKAELARRAGMSEVYLHQLFSGRRRPSRDKLLCLCIGMELTLDETQRLLKEAAYVQLYPRIKREAIIYHGIIHHTPLNEINDNLFREGEKALC